jgi:hypothetical protein
VDSNKHFENNKHHVVIRVCIAGSNTTLAQASSAHPGHLRPGACHSQARVSDVQCAIGHFLFFGDTGSDFILPIETLFEEPTSYGNAMDRFRWGLSSAIRRIIVHARKFRIRGNAGAPGTRLRFRLPRIPSTRHSWKDAV